MIQLQPASLDTFQTKYQLKKQDGTPVDKDLEGTFVRVARALASVEKEDELVNGLPAQTVWGNSFLWALENGAIPAGRILSNAGAEELKPNTSLINCTVSANIPDNIEGIGQMVKESMQTLAKGCGIGYCASTLRPKGAFVGGVGATTSGSLSFMNIFDASCFTISSAGGRRGAQMMTMHVWHPDILDFIKAKREDGRFRQFNLSVLLTDEFMEAVQSDDDWQLFFPLHKKEKDSWHTSVNISNFPFSSEDYVTVANGDVVCKVYQTIKARELWDLIMKSTYEYAEPGVLFIDRINESNPLNSEEVIVATNPSLAKGTLVHTKEGIFPIELLENKQFQVRALDGTWGNATCWLSSEKTNTISIDFGSSRVIRATPKHKFPVVDKETGLIKRKLVSDLEVGDEIPKNLVEPLGIEGDMTLTEEEGFFLGLWLADGSLTTRKTGGYAMYLSFNKRDRELAEKALNYLNRIKVNPSTISDSGNEFTIQLTTTPVIEYLKERLGIHSGTKYIPELVYTSNDSFIKGFIDGLISGDGHIDVKQTKITLVNKDKEFILSIAKLLSFMGITGIIGESVQTGNFPNGKDYDKLYKRVSLAYGKAATQKFASLFSLSCRRKQAALEAVSEDVMKKGARRDYYLRVANIVPNDIEEPVWDISVEHPQHLFPIEWGYTGNCGEQPLPPYGSCLLGSILLTKFVENPFEEEDLSHNVIGDEVFTSGAEFNWYRFKEVTRIFVRMLDNVVELNGLALEQQVAEIKNKRRHGMGFLGLGSALAMLRIPYGSAEAIAFTEEVSKVIAVVNLEENYKLGKEKGCAPIFEDDEVYEAWLKHDFTQKVLEETSLDTATKSWTYLRTDERPRFTHATSVAPTGTLSLAIGNNCSNGIEPSFAHEYKRNIVKEGNKTKEQVTVYSVEALAWKELYGDTSYPDYFIVADDLTPAQHVAMQAAAQKWVDSSISKTVNCPTDISFEDFKQVYIDAYNSGLKGCATFRFNPEIFSGVLVREEDLAATTYEFTLANGEIVVLAGNETVIYEGEPHNVANLFDALKEGYFGRF